MAQKISDNYYKERNERGLLRLREILDTLPPFAQEFFIGVQMRTTVLTRLNYAYDLRIFFHYLSVKKYRNLPVEEIALIDLEKLTAYDIELYLDYLSRYEIDGKTYTCEEKAKERKLSSLRSFFKYYFKKDKLTANVCAKVDLPKLHDKPIIRLDAQEVQALLTETETGENLTPRQKSYQQKLNKRDTAIITLFLGTGIRVSELVGLNREDFDFDANSFTVTRKGGNKSILYFSDEVKSSLLDYLAWLDEKVITDRKNNEFGFKVHHSPTPNAMFFSNQGSRYSVRAVEYLVKKYSKIVTPLKHITPHKLRSTFGTSLYHQTQDIYVVADVLGHSDINTTKKHYAQMSEDIRKKAANAVVLRPDDNKDD
ncbi:MAG: tyrosine-type recombinase/integrase [Clostridiales bacterium]|nr:tyrosine-type recombinase/integrase [Clostridiales bacterium]